MWRYGSDHEQFFLREQPEDHDIYRYHFAFRKECIHGALLELIIVSVGRAKAKGSRFTST